MEERTESALKNKRTSETSSRSNRHLQSREFIEDDTQLPKKGADEMAHSTSRQLREARAYPRTACRLSGDIAQLQRKMGDMQQV